MGHRNQHRRRRRLHQGRRLLNSSSGSLPARPSLLTQVAQRSGIASFSENRLRRGTSRKPDYPRSGRPSPDMATRRFQRLLCRSLPARYPLATKGRVPGTRPFEHSDHQPARSWPERMQQRLLLAVGAFVAEFFDFAHGVAELVDPFGLVVGNQSDCPSERFAA